MVGWLLPSSRFVVERVLEQVDWPATKLIVEYGPGLGNFTGRILQQMRADAQLVTLDINPDFIAYLRKNFFDPRLQVLERSAADIDKVLSELGLGPADCVISGIPFKTIPHSLREEVVRKTFSALRPGGRFLVYQFSTAVVPYLENAFGDVDCGREFLNLVPTRLFFCRRPSGPAAPS